MGDWYFTGDYPTPDELFRQDNVLDEQVEVPKHFIKIGQSHIYDKVFILPPWQEIFANDHERIENFDETEAIHNELIKTYTAYGMPPIVVPKFSVQKRVCFLNDHL